MIKYSQSRNSVIRAATPVDPVKRGTEVYLFLLQ